jgi:E3 ubiquitin-protein ligase UBR7
MSVPAFITTISTNSEQQFDTCTRDLGPLRQILYACLTCNPPPAATSDAYTPAAVCYSCSISCHGEHTLVELFNKRNFNCDCGTTRIPETTPCTLRINEKTGLKGGVTGEEPAATNKYNHNFRNWFCGCGEDYNSDREKGTMFQCLGLGTVEDGGCGEDWWHPECLVGYTRTEYEKMIEKPMAAETNGSVEKPDISMSDTDESNSMPETAIITEDMSTANGEPNGHVETTESTSSVAINAAVSNGTGVDGNDIAADAEEDEDPPLPPGFPAEDDFDHFLCYKCVRANPWIKKYAGSTGFFAPVYNDKALNAAHAEGAALPSTSENTDAVSKKRKASDDGDDETPSALPTLLAPAPAKRQRSEDPGALSSIPEDNMTLPIKPKKPVDTTTCKLTSLPPLSSIASSTPFSLFLKPDFRDHICHCASCFLFLKPHPQLLEEEETYEPPVSEDGEGAQSVGTGSLLDRGEAAFNNMDRVRAIQGAMAYAHLKDKLGSFLKPFAESGQAVGAEDIKAYFEKLRGDEQGIQEAAGGAKATKNDEADGQGGAEGGGRKEQSGY